MYAKVTKAETQSLWYNKEDAKHACRHCGRGGADSLNSPFEVHICRSSNPYWVLSHWRGKHLKLHRGWRQRRQFLVMLPKIPWNMVVPPDSTTWRANSCGDQRRSSCRREVSLASSPVKLGWNNTSAQLKRSSPTVMMFSVWENVVRIIV